MRKCSPSKLRCPQGSQGDNFGVCGVHLFDIVGSSWGIFGHCEVMLGTKMIPKITIGTFGGSRDSA